MNTTVQHAASVSFCDDFVPRLRRWRLVAGAALFAIGAFATVAPAATPCDTATNPGQCAWLAPSSLPPYVQDAVAAKGGVIAAGEVLILTSGDPLDPDTEISTDRSLPGCGTNPDGWETYDCTLMKSFVPPVDSVVLALSSEWYEWYQTIFTDWMTISGAGVATVDVSINSWIDNKVDIIPYGPWETGVVLLTSLSAKKMVDFRVSDSGDHIYDTAIVVVPAAWFSSQDVSGNDPTLLCGDGQLEPGEDCDDGNLIADDDCSNLCLGVQAPPSSPPVASTCGNLVYKFPNGSTAPYTCGQDLCGGYRCVVGNTISPACYTAAQCAAACGGGCVDVQAAALDCSTMCAVQPPATEPPPALPQACDQLVYSWPDGATKPYTCDDLCAGQRCVTGATIDPTCYSAGECDATTCPDGTCVDTPASDCNALCALAELPDTCAPEELGHTRSAVVQSGPCLGNMEMCKSTGLWGLDDNAFNPEDERCNGVDDDCNGIVDDMFVTCGDPGLCQNTVNACDPSNPSVPVVCQTLPQPSPVEICNNGLDDDCEGSVDDGCECGDDECMPGEDWSNCPADCPMPPNGAVCNDSNPCTSGDHWQTGLCVGYAVTCESANACVEANVCDPAIGCTATKVNCDDAVACTVDTCDQGTGCANTPEDSACSDGDPCTIDACDATLGCTSTPDPACAGQDEDNDGYVAVTDGGDDCDDSNPDVNPGAVEVCNGIDDNCDAQVDEDWPTQGETCFSIANSCGATDAGLLVCDAAGTGLDCTAMTPSDPIDLGNACSSSANSCGQTGAGTIQCDGSCNAVIPSDPVDLGSACLSSANVCGETASGTIQCDGSCNAVIPSDPVDLGSACLSSANVCGETASGTIQCDGSCNAVIPPAADSDSDGTADCVDQCAADAAKTAPGDCGCGTPDVDTNGNGISDCLETTSADLGITAATRTRTPTAGKSLRVRWDVTNAGPDLVDPGATIVGAISGAVVSDLRLPKSCSGTADSFVCTTSVLKAGRHKAAKVKLVPAAGSTLVFSFSVSGPLVDPNPVNQSTSVEVLVP